MNFFAALCLAFLLVNPRPSSMAQADGLPMFTVRWTQAATGPQTLRVTHPAHARVVGCYQWSETESYCLAPDTLSVDIQIATAREATVTVEPHGEPDRARTFTVNPFILVLPALANRN